MKLITKIFSVLFLLAFCMPVDAATVARSATKQNAINVGTKIEVSSATKSSPCQEKYEACMDTGCIVDNDSGGRCQCSNQIKDLNAELSKIKSSVRQAQKIEADAKEIKSLGKFADDIMADDDFDEEEDLEVSLGDVWGDKLRAQMHETCAAKIPECSSQLKLVKNMYAQKVKSDCAAFENSLKSVGRESRAAKALAEKSMRDVALANLQESNKYDLGQCVIEFTSCMQTTAECGKDFTGCVSTVGKESIYDGVINQVFISGENTSVKIAKSTMDMLESKKLICESVLSNCVKVQDKVWDAFLRANAPQIKIAESKAESNIRTSCLDKVSDCFVNACKEHIDGNDSYDMCLTRPETVKNLCKVEIEPCLAATGGSYDKPEDSTLWPSVLAKLSAMRVDSCTREIKECMQSPDRCGSDYSQCIGLDTNIIMRMCPYDKLLGCQKVYGKEKVMGDMVYDEVAQIVEGVILNIDNEMLATCETSVDNAMTRVCGDTESCGTTALGSKIGAQSLEYRVCQYSTDSPDSTKGFKWFDCRASINDISDYELGRDKNAKSEELGIVLPFAGVITGIIKWESIELGDDGRIDIDAYMDALDKEKDVIITEREKSQIKDEIMQLQNDINNIINSVEQDAFVQYCMTGRTVPGVTDMFGDNKARFPKIINSAKKTIAMATLQQAKDNYYAKYDKLSERMQSDLVRIQKRIAQNAKLNGEDAVRAAAREACVGMAAVSAFAKAPVGQSLWAKIVVGIIVIAAIVVACVFCPPLGGAAGALLGASEAAAGAAIAAAAVSASAASFFSGLASAAFAAGVSAAVTTAALAATAAASIAYTVADGVETAKTNASNAEAIAAQQTNVTPTHGEYYANEWNYQEKITTDFDNDTKICKKCVSKRQCKKTKWSLFSERSCKKWESDEFTDERCTEIQF